MPTDTNTTRVVNPDPPPLEDKLARWKREGTEQMELEQQARRERDARALVRRIVGRVRDEMAEMIEQHKQDYLLSENGLLPQVLVGLRHEISDEICNAIERAYAKAFADVRADLNALRQAVTKVAGDGAIIDLPPLPSMRGVKLN